MLFRSHVGFPGARNAKIRSAFPNSGASAAAENVAMFSGGGGDVAQRLVDMWINSPGHRANMLGGYRTFGAGYAKGWAGNFGTQIFGY